MTHEAHERTVRLWDEAGLMVLARFGEGGALVLEGQDLSLPGEDGEMVEYEYAFAIPRREIGKLLRALHAPESADPLAVLEQRGAELVRAGESRWLARHGIKAEFWSRIG